MLRRILSSIAISYLADRSQMPMIKVSIPIFSLVYSCTDWLPVKKTFPLTRCTIEELMPFHYLATVQLGSGSNFVIAAAMSVVVFPKSF
jgi:hypothetical protein